MIGTHIQNAVETPLCWLKTEIFMTGKQETVEKRGGE